MNIIYQIFIINFTIIILISFSHEAINERRSLISNSYLLYPKGKKIYIKIYIFSEIEQI